MSTILRRKCIVALLGCLLFTTATSFGGIVYQEPGSNTVRFLEMVSAGGNKICSYMGSVDLKPRELPFFHSSLKQRETMDAKTTLLNRWEIIGRADRMKVFGPTSPSDLFSDVVDQTVPIRQSTILGSALIGLGVGIQYLGLQFILIYDEFTMDMINQAEKLLLTKVAVDEAGIEVKKKLFGLELEKLGVKSRYKKNPQKSYDELADFLRRLIRDQRVIEFKLIKKAIQHSAQIGSTGLLLSFIGFTIAGVSKQIYSNHEIRSILSNSILVESQKDNFDVFANMVSQMPEDVHTGCPSVSDKIAEFRSGDFSSYQYDKFELPSQKRNFKVIIDDILRTLIQIN